MILCVSAIGYSNIINISTKTAESVSGCCEYGIGFDRMPESEQISICQLLQIAYVDFVSALHSETERKDGSVVCAHKV